MNRPDKKPPWFELAAARTKSHFTGESELAATTERRVIEAVARRKRKPKAFWLIPITLVGSGSLAWAEEVELAVLWTVQHVQGLVRTEEPPTETATAVAEAKRGAQPRRERATLTSASVPRDESMVDTVDDTAAETTVPTVALESPLATTTLTAPVSPRVMNSSPTTPTRPTGNLRSRTVTPVEPSSNASPVAEPSDLERYRIGYVAQYERHDYRAALLAWDAYLQHVSGGRFTPDVRYHRALALVELGRNHEAMAALRPFAAGAYGPLRQQSAKNLLRELGDPAGTSP